MSKLKFGRLIRDSIALVLSNPKLFIPKILTTILYSLYDIWLVIIAADTIMIPGKMVSVDLTKTLMLMFAALGFLMVMDLLVYGMYPKMVQDYHSKKKASLKRALQSSFESWKTLLMLGLSILAVMVLMSIILVFAMVFTMISGYWWIYGIGVLFTVIIMIFYSVLVFFVVPASVVDNQGVLKSFKASYDLGMENKILLTKLNILFFVLTLFTMYLIFISRFDGGSLLAYLLFLLVRGFQVVVHTFLLVTNPLGYLSAKD